MSLFYADRLLGCAVCAINFITSCSVSEKAALKWFNSTNTAGCFSSLIAPLSWRPSQFLHQAVNMYISAVKVDILTWESMGTSQPLVATEGTAVFFFFLPLTLFLFIFVLFFQKSISPPELHLLLKYNPLSTFLIFLWLKRCIGMLYFWSIGFCSFSGENFLKVTIAQVTSVSF